MRRSIAAVPTPKKDDLVNYLKDHSYELNDPDDLEPLFEAIGDRKIVLLGESSHGTHEFYTWRSYISRKLIEEKGFDFVAVEGDWPDCFRINNYVKAYDQQYESAKAVLKTFNRWPTWMWANTEVAGFVHWLRNHNDAAAEKSGFYGLDVYSLWESLTSIMDYLRQTDPQALDKVIETYQCFEPYKEDGVSYAYASRLVPELCEDAVLALLKEIQNKMPTYDSGVENVFSTEQNALIAVNAEKYYRAMIRGDAESWNIRDQHMHDTLDRLLELHGSNSKAIIWAHNTHVGDASATDMKADGMTNLGELARGRFGDATFIVGFGTFKGSVIAAEKWGANMQKMMMPAAPSGSWEEIMNKVGGDRLTISSQLDPGILNYPVGHRAVGVVYRPALDNFSNYAPSVMDKRYDAFVFINQTKALHPLHLQTEQDQVPDTWPFGE